MPPIHFFEDCHILGGNTIFRYSFYGFMVIEQSLVGSKIAIIASVIAPKVDNEVLAMRLLEELNGFLDPFRVGVSGAGREANQERLVGDLAGDGLVIILKI